MSGSNLFSKRLLGGSAAALAVGSVLGAALIASSAASGAAVAAGTPSCQTAGLVVWLDTNGNGAAGTIHYTLNFTNLSGHACTLRGYPGVSAINLRGGKLGNAASRHSARVRTIKLKRGATAHADLALIDAAVGSAPGCHPTTAAGLRIFPPNQTASRTIPFPFQACGHTGTTYLTISPVHS